MSGDLLRTKLYAPRFRPGLVSRPQLVALLNHGLQRGCKLTLISAAAGFGKTTLVSEWITKCDRPFAWLSLDERESDLGHFLAYFVAALQTVAANVGQRVSGMVESAQPPPAEAVLTVLVNDIAAVADEFVLVLDDYHVMNRQAIDGALTFLLDHMPPQLHLVIATREDPNLPLSRLRARGQLSEVRASDLRFSQAEAAAFLQQEMGLEMRQEEVTALAARTEGWIAGLQLAALSLQGQEDASEFVQSFSGSHRFVLDYLVEEVLQRQPESVQEFLQKTAVLNQLSGSLCDALTDGDSGQEILEWLERANLFLVPLDNERRWYRYHQLFVELLRQRLWQRMAEGDVAELHIRASQWYEAHGLALEAFHHAAAANDVERAARLIAGEGVPLYFRGEATRVQQWLASLPEAEFEARPALRVTYASVLTMTGRLQDDIEESLQAAERALGNASHDEGTADLLGQIAAIRAMLAVPKNQVDRIIEQSQRALALLNPDNGPMRTATMWALGYAYQVQGDRGAASRAYEETIAHSQKTGNLMTEIAATTCLGQIRETQNRVQQAAESFQRVLQLVGDPPWPAACEAYVGLGRLHYLWNEVDVAEEYAEQGLELARQLENVDTPATCGVLLARVQLARGDTAGALTTLAEAEQFARQHHFEHWAGEIAAVRVQVLLRQKQLAAAAQLAQIRELPISQARVYLAQADPRAALIALAAAGEQAVAQEWAGEALQVLILQALSYQALGESERAIGALNDALVLAAPEGLIRPFVDEGEPLAALLEEAQSRGVAATYAQQLLAAIRQATVHPARTAWPLADPLSERELEVLRLMRSELSGPEIASELMVSLNTMRTHSKNIYSKLGVNSRRAAVRQAEELKLI